MEKCLAFCQSLIKSDQKFALNLSIGNDRFFFSNKELKSSWKKKKKSPSQLPREENRKRNHQNKAAEEVVDNGADEATAEKVEINSRAAFISCKECGHKATTENGLKQHKPSGHPPYKHQTSSRQPMTTSRQNLSMTHSLTHSLTGTSVTRC